MWVGGGSIPFSSNIRSYETPPPSSHSSLLGYLVQERNRRNYPVSKFCCIFHLVGVPISATPNIKGGFRRPNNIGFPNGQSFRYGNFLTLQKLAHGNKSLPLKGRRPPGDTRLFFPHANFRVKFPYLKPKKLYT